MTQGGPTNFSRPLHFIPPSSVDHSAAKKERLHSFTHLLGSDLSLDAAMADCRGQAFAQRDQATCAYVRALCGYVICTDSLGDHCYGIDSLLGYRVGQHEPAGNGTCSQAASYCPMARDTYYIPDVHGINM